MVHSKVCGPIQSTNILILKLLDLSSSKFDTGGLSLVLVVLTDSDVKAVTALYRDTIHTNAKKSSVGPPIGFHACSYAYDQSKATTQLRTT